MENAEASVTLDPTPIAADPPPPASRHHEPAVSGSASSTAHLPALDGVRGVALLAVLAFHFVGHGPGAAAWPTWLRASALAGWAGVDLFFVLSGFLITRILLAARGRRGAIGAFYLRRALRIFPLYYTMLAVLTLALLVAGLREGEARHVAALWLYVTNFDVARHGFGVAIFRSAQFTHLWTLAIEEQFYLVWPWLILLVPRRLLMPACGGVIVVATLVRVGMIRAGAGGEAVYVSTGYRADTLAWGAAAAVAMATWPADVVRRAGATLAVVGLLATATIVAVRQSVSEYDPLVQSVGYTALAVSFAGGIAVLAAGGPWGRPLTHRLLTGVGRVSYGAYLFHVPLRGVASFVWQQVLHRNPKTLTLTQAALTAALLTLATLGLAALSFRYFERPFLRLKPKPRRASD